MADGDLEVTEDRLLGGAVRLLQPRRGHRAGTDAVLLAGLVGVRPGELVADFGAATGAVGLMIAVRHPTARLLLAERDPDLADLAARNLALNGLDQRGRALRVDLFGPRPERRSAGLESGIADLVVTNPPYSEGEGRPSPEARRRAAHEMAGGVLSDWFESAADLLREKGRLAVIYRADGLERCLSALRPRFGSVEITPIHPRAGEDASRIFVASVKGGRSPLRIAPALVLHNADGGFTPAAERLHRLET